ncbi:hypothetical protein GCM10009678_87000 [Actinomadura kijaniata]|uniref:Uncharacterized protein n=1 Tax=Actinomadura namibiensis TaxID=182080 RepID=A0A7W3LW36_ACTNM|nr:hypothetical protein [Actinomadura namibiensis]MBA8955368.1 hypothetical protein [Actinomadura namibiensis]
MPQQRRFRRLGSATAVSAGTLALVFLGAPAAHAGTAGTTQCKKGTDPASTIENWKCQWKNWQDSLKPKPKPTPKPTPKPKPSTKPPAKVDKDKSRPKPRDGAPKVRVPQGNPSAPGGAAPMNQPEGLRPYKPGDAPAPANLPGVLPTPQVADPGAFPAPSGAVPQTRLISPVAAADHDSTEMVWVAAAAGAAGAMLGVNLSAVGRRLRRPRG